MPWNDTAREWHNRDHLRYSSDLTDEEWAILAPFVPPEKPRHRPRKTDMREVVNAIQYIVGSGCRWLMLPQDFPPVSTVRGYFHAWQDAGLWQTINQSVGDEHPETGRPQSQPDSGGDRQPEREDHRKRWGLRP